MSNFILYDEYSWETSYPVAESTAILDEDDLANYLEGASENDYPEWMSE